jgi:integrase
MSHRLPQYPKRPHKRGQARIKIKGKDVWLGKFGTPESHAEYARIIRELQAGGMPTADDDEPVSCAELINNFRQWAEKRYVKNGEPTSEPYLFTMALAPVIELYGDTPVNNPGDEFGPLALLACRDWLRDVAGYCREKINSHLGRIRRVWKWGVSRQIVRESSWTALTAVEGFRKGEAPDLPAVKPVPVDRVNAIKDFVLPPIWAMIQLELATGMRPGEVCTIRTRDIIREDTAIPLLVRKLCWTYTPESHKCEHHGRDRIILLGPKAQRIIEPWLKWDNLDAYIFSPAEAMDYVGKVRSSNASTRRTNFKRKNDPERIAGDRYKTGTYANAVKRGCEKAFGMPREWRVKKKSQSEETRAKAIQWREANCWNPNQLRHTAATEIRKEYGIEIASIILGHSTLNTTQVYAEADLEEAAKAMATFG